MVGHPWCGLICARNPGYIARQEVTMSNELNFKFSDHPEVLPFAMENHKDQSYTEKGSSDNLTTDQKDELEVIRTISRVPGNPNYHVKNGLRIEGDGFNHQEWKLTFKIFMALLGCSLAFVGSQMIPLFYFTLYTRIAIELNAESFVWLPAAGILGQVAAAVSLGPISDLFSRKTIFLAGVFLSMIGMILCAATPNSTGWIAGSAISGYGLIVEELLAIAVCAELVPTERRTVYGAAMISGFIPWAPGALYAQLIANYSWRWIGCLIAIWNVLALIILLIFYNPPPRVNSRGLSRRQILGQIDFIGIALGLSGLTVFLLGLFWGGTPYAWNSAHVVCSLSVGAGLCVVFVLWELYGTNYPLFPRRLVQVKRPFWMIMFVIFTAGINYISLAVFWPIESIAVFESDHTHTGINTVAVGICILGGAVISGLMCGIFRNHVYLVMTLFCVMQTAGVGAMAAIDMNNINTVWAPLVIALLGIGGVLFPNQLVVTIITPDDLLATVTSLTFVVRGVGQVISIALLQNRLIHEVTKNVTNIVVPVGIANGLLSVEAFTSLANNLTAIPFPEYAAKYLPNLSPEGYMNLQEACRLAFHKSFPLLYYIGLGFGVAACIASVLMGNIAKYMDEHVAVVLD